MLILSTHNIYNKMNIIIIGATSGIGKEIAGIYINQGHKVGLTGRRKALLEEIKGDNENIHISTYDVNAEDAPVHLMELIEQMGGVERVIYSSGYGKSNPELDLEKELHTADVNVKGFMRHATTLFNYWNNNNLQGHMTVISSIAGIRSLGIAPSYSATKNYQSFYFEALRQLASMKKAKISFTAIKPGFVATDFIAGKNYPFTLNKEIVARKIVKAVDRKRKNYVIYGIWRPIALLMRIIPPFLWRGAIGRLIGRSDN